MKRRLRFNIMLLAALTFSVLAGCSAVPLELSLWSPIQTADEDTDVHGVRMNLLYAKNRDIIGLDAGVGLNDCANMAGLQ